MDKLASHLPKCEKLAIQSKYFNHFDFLMGRNVKSLLHYFVVNIVNKNNNVPEITSTVSTKEPHTPHTRPTNTMPSTSSILTSQGTDTGPTATTPSASSGSTSQETSVSPHSTNKPTLKPNSGFSLEYSIIIYLVSGILFLID